MQAKYCEVCGTPFFRRFAPTRPYERHRNRLYSVAGATEFESELRRDRGEKFCKNCRGRALQPDTKKQEEYLDQLPTSREARRTKHYGVPDYRDLNPVRRGNRGKRPRFVEERQLTDAQVEKILYRNLGAKP